MQKIFVLICYAFVLLCNTSCEEYMDIQNIPISQDTIQLDPKIEKLISQARQGEVKAYNALAVCYRDGDGVKQSVFNMMTMYMLSCEKSGKDIEDVIDSLDENHPIRLLTDVLDHSYFENVPQEAVTKLRNISPADALIYDAIYTFKYKNDTLATQQLLKEAEMKGSDMACILQILFCENFLGKEKLKQTLLHYAVRFPVLYVKLGNLSMQDDSEGHWEQAVKYYTLADKYGMLTINGARRLSSAYRMLEKEGKMKCNQQEMIRLETLAQYN